MNTSYRGSSQVVGLGERRHGLAVIPDFDLAAAAIDRRVELDFMPDTRADDDRRCICMRRGRIVVSICQASVFGDEDAADRGIGGRAHLDEIEGVRILAVELEPNAVINRRLFARQRFPRIRECARALS